MATPKTISNQLKVYAYINSNGDCTALEISKTFGFSSGYTTELLRSLVNAGYLRFDYFKELVQLKDGRERWQPVKHYMVEKQ